MASTASGCRATVATTPSARLGRRCDHSNDMVKNMVRVVVSRHPRKALLEYLKVGQKTKQKPEKRNARCPEVEVSDTDF